MNRTLSAALSVVLAGVTLPALAQTVVPLREGLSLTHRVTRASASVETTLRVTAVNARTLKLGFESRKADGSVLRSTRSVRVSDLQNAHSIRPNFVDGSAEYFAGSTAFGTSTAVLAELKQNGSTALTVDVGGIGIGAGVSGAGLGREIDGMLGDMGGFAGVSEALQSAAAHGAINDSELAEGNKTLGDIDQLQMASGTLRAAGRTTLTITVNGRALALPGIVAKGDVGTDTEHYAAEFVFLDDPANPLLLKSRIGKDSTQLLRIDYPAAK